jgi:aryl-alcohol dehydrogenase-like predicted oxidoreductase
VVGGWSLLELLHPQYRRNTSVQLINGGWPTAPSTSGDEITGTNLLILEKKKGNMTPRILFGAGGIGEGRISHTWTTPSTVTELLTSLDRLGLKQLDSAASYPPGAPWITETLLGGANAAEQDFIIDTKIEVTSGPEGQGTGHLSEAHINESVKKTLKLLGVQKV